MQTNVIDIIVYLARQLNTGVDIKDIDEKPLEVYNRAEVGAAYSWIIQKYGISDMPDSSDSEPEYKNPEVNSTGTASNEFELKPFAGFDEFAQSDSDPIHEIYEKLKRSHPHRILHPAEEMILPTESYGYLLELHYIGLINQDHLESIIERIMLHHDEPVEIGKLKHLIAEVVFDESHSGGSSNSGNLTGDETIH